MPAMVVGILPMTMSVFALLQCCPRPVSTKGSQCVGKAAWAKVTTNPVAARDRKNGCMNVGLWVFRDLSELVDECALFAGRQSQHVLQAVVAAGVPCQMKIIAHPGCVTSSLSTVSSQSQVAR
jgi:hypothetical protein